MTPVIATLSTHGSGHCSLSHRTCVFKSRAFHTNFSKHLSRLTPHRNASHSIATSRLFDNHRQSANLRTHGHPYFLLHLTSLLMTNIVERVCYRHMEMLTAPIIVHDYCYYCWWCTRTVLYQKPAWQLVNHRIATRDCSDPAHYCISVTRSYATPLDYYHQHGVL